MMTKNSGSKVDRLLTSEQKKQVLEQLKNNKYNCSKTYDNSDILKNICTKQVFYYWAWKQFNPKKFDKALKNSRYKPASYETKWNSGNRKIAKNIGELSEFSKFLKTNKIKESKFWVDDKYKKYQEYYKKLWLREIPENMTYTKWLLNTEKI